MPGPGTGPRPGGWETLAYPTDHSQSLYERVFLPKFFRLDNLLIPKMYFILMYVWNLMLINVPKGFISTLHARHLMYIIVVPIRPTIHGNYKICQLISVVQFMCQYLLMFRVCDNVSDLYKIRGFVSPMLSVSYRDQNYGVLQNTCTTWHTLFVKFTL